MAPPGATAVGGGRLSPVAGVVSPDGSRLLLAVGPVLKVFSAATGEKLLDLVGHRADITRICRDPRHPNQVVTASLDGSVRVWDFVEGEKVKKIRARKQVSGLVAHGPWLYIATHKQHAQRGQILRLDMKNKGKEHQFHEMSPGRELTMSPDGSLLGTFERHTLTIWKPSVSLEERVTLHHTKKFTCIAFDPSGTRVAAGDVSGRILVWQSLEAALVPGAMSQADHKAPLTTLHWHSTAVSCLCFSQDGTYMLSGGAEAVLVIWQLATGQRTYLPRLGGALRAIAPGPDPATFLVTQADSTARLINISTMQVECTVSGVLPPPRSVPPELGTGPSRLQPGTGYLALPAENAVLQFYDVVHDRDVSQLQVAPRNSVSLTLLREEADVSDGSGLVEEPRVSHLAFSSDSDWLATAEVRQFLGTGRSVECHLKFWERASSSNGASGGYSLNTRVDAPHSREVSCMAYHPNKHMVVTGSDDGQFKVWVRHRVANLPGGGGNQDSRPQWGWRCRSAGVLSHPESSGRPDIATVGAAAFSCDGSLVALACGGRVSLWEPESNSLLSHLPGPPGSSQSSFISLCFCSETPFLVGISSGDAPSLVVWNLLTSSIWWSYALSASLLTSDPGSGFFAVALPRLTESAAKPCEDDQSPAQQSSTAATDCPSQAHVLLFDPAACKPLAAWRMRNGSTAASLAFATPGSAVCSRFSGTAGAAPLVVANDSRELAVLGRPASLGPKGSPAVAAGKGAGAGLSLEEVFGAAADKPQTVMENLASTTPAASSWAELFDTPSHALPSLAELCPAFLEMLVSGGPQAEQ